MHACISLSETFALPVVTSLPAGKQLNQVSRQFFAPIAYYVIRASDSCTRSQIQSRAAAALRVRIEFRD